MNMWDEFERHLRRWVVISLVLLVVVQGLMTNDNIRYFLSIGERMEGSKIAVTASSTADKQLSSGTVPAGGSLELVKADGKPARDALVLINGKPAARFDSPQVLLQVEPGDEIKIDTRSYQEPITFRVGKISPDLDFPLPTMTFTCRQEVLDLGRIHAQ
jgi:hypothetical protein